jgi:uncharacterized membrane protein
VEAKKNSIKFIVGSLSFSVFIKLCSLFKLNYIVGSHAACFSAATALSPLAGVYGATFGITAFLFGSFFKLLAGINPICYIVYHIPSLCGALFWAGSRLVFGCLLPLGCMALFIAHPEGGAAWVYSLYWLIPVTLFLSGRRHIFTDALSCIFVMHAVGSVIWLYMAYIPATVWLALIPVVAVERFLLACAMASAYLVMQATTTFFKELYVRRIASHD